MNKRSLVVWVGALVLLWAAFVHPVWAHGGGIIYAAGEAAGPYLVTVWVAPNTIEAGKTLHFTVAVVQPEGNRPVLDADVMMVVLADGADMAVLSGTATTEQSVNKLFYEADFQAPVAAGVYQVQAQVSGVDGEGVVSFDLVVEPARRNNLLLIGLVGVLLVTALGILLARRGEKAAAAD